MFRHALTEKIKSKSNSATKKAVGLAKALDKKEELRAVMETINPDFATLPKIKSKTASGVAKEYNIILKNHRSLVQELQSLNSNAVGQGELMLCYLGDHVTMGGSTATVDLTIGSDKVEVKCNPVNKSGWMTFRFGTKMKTATRNLQNDFRELVSFALSFGVLNGEYKEKLKAGEISSTPINQLRNKNLDYAIDNYSDKYINVKITNTGAMSLTGKTSFANLFKKDGVEKLRSLAKGANNKIYKMSEIDERYRKIISGQPYFLIDNNTGKLYHQSIGNPGDIVRNWSQGSLEPYIKVK